MPAIRMAEVSTDIRDFVGRTTRTHRRQHIPGPSVGSAMAGLQEATLPGDGPALAASTAGGGGFPAGGGFPGGGGGGINSLNQGGRTLKGKKRKTITNSPGIRFAGF